MPNVGPLEIAVVLVIAAFWIAVIALVIYGVIRLVRGLSGHDPVSAAAVGDPALDDLRSRFARGEIDEAEYQRRRSVLQAR
jgi:putative membrane protein